MDALMSLFEGFTHALTPMNLLWVLVGCFLGTAVGVLPGLGSSMAVALLLPMTFALDPTGAFIMFAGVYFGGLFGDSTMAILMNTPGQASAIASTFEGHKMARNGRAPQALATAAIGAFIGGFISCCLVVFVAPSSGRLLDELRSRRVLRTRPLRLRGDLLGRRGLRAQGPHGAGARHRLLGHRHRFGLRHRTFHNGRSRTLRRSFTGHGDRGDPGPGRGLLHRLPDPPQGQRQYDQLIGSPLPLPQGVR